MLMANTPSNASLRTIANTEPERAQSMKAIVQSGYGSADKLRFTTLSRPAIGDHEVLVQVKAAAVCRGDVHLLTGKPYLLRLMTGLCQPRSASFGQDLAGKVMTVGSKVNTFKPGDEVFGQLGVAGGAFAEYACVPADGLAAKPAGLSFEQAATLADSGVTALQALRDIGQLQAGQRLLINGASGGVGSFAVQIAKALGAQVTAVCSSRHLEMVSSIGADQVIDYRQQDFAAPAAHGEHAVRYDLMLDLVGNRALADCKRVLTSNGRYVASAGKPGKNWLGPLVWMGSIALANACASQNMTSFIVKPCQHDLLELKRLVEAGQLTPVIERHYPLQHAAQALRHVAAGHAQGKTVITI